MTRPAHSSRDIIRINQEVIRKYCLLVHNHSRKGYSEIVARCINYIELNPQEDLCLGELVPYLNVNPSYLSVRFKKEVGMMPREYRSRMTGMVQDY